MWYNTKVTQLLGVQYPIMLGPFGGNFSSIKLTALVSNLGGDKEATYCFTSEKLPDTPPVLLNVPVSVLGFAETFAVDV